MSSHLNPKNSTKSTWRRLGRAEWTIFHWFYEILSIHPMALDKEVPVHDKQEKVPYMPEWYLHRWVLVHSFIPLAIHQVYLSYTDQNLTPFAAFIFYTTAFQVITIHEIHILRRMGHLLGFLNGDQHERDGVPDVGVQKVIHSLVSASTFRPMFTVFFSYRASQPPSSMSWLWLPLEVGFYGIILDFDSLWKYHRTHHLTKHPNPLLTLHADMEQEIFDIAGIPLMAYFNMKLMGFPMGFYEYGLRLHSITPSTLSWFLKVFNAEVIIEDHDIHHRRGWRKSVNYGKQTRLWDRVFGTCGDRVECHRGNIDYDNKISMPLI
ncbi:hypothetical protein BDV24DRAFT_156950 [Aspergillus arachidicola]|uniref:Fatty acid hydroxylase domain-containing protein n=1 Tax=Aspergillus arachidicola TaxID=656916 RepID=A0A5N6XMW0_9EURO|nr:hypothetical protein BDV24DRAFT_156950 [Aspergillus arachidicola]